MITMVPPVLIPIDIFLVDCIQLNDKNFYNHLEFSTFKLSYTKNNFDKNLTNQFVLAPFLLNKS